MNRRPASHSPPAELRVELAWEATAELRLLAVAEDLSLPEMVDKLVADRYAATFGEGIGLGDAADEAERLNLLARARRSQSRG